MWSFEFFGLQASGKRFEATSDRRGTARERESNRETDERNIEEPVGFLERV
jgi:hypothetical protein